MTARKTILDMLTRAADSNLPCPTNGEIAHAIDANSPATAARWVAALEKDGAIGVERGTACRVVTITATGRRTAGTVTKPHWRLSDAKKAEAASRKTRARSLNLSEEAFTSQPRADLPRVHRDPCFYCGARGDVGCQHRSVAA